MHDDGPPAGCLAGFMLVVLMLLFYALVGYVVYLWLFGLGPFVRSSV